MSTDVHADRILDRVTARFDTTKLATADFIKTEAEVNRQSVTRAKLETLKGIRKELASARAEDHPDADVIEALVDLLKDTKASK